MRFYYYLIILLVTMTAICTSGCRKQTIDARDFGRIRIDSVSPGKGPAGSYFEVYGDNFTIQASDVTATIGDVRLTVVSASVTKLLLKLPDNAVAGVLTLRFNRIQSSIPNSGDAMEKEISTTLFAVDPTAVPGPIICEVAPAGASPYRTVTIKGYNFSELSDAQVWLGAVQCERLSVNDTVLTIKIPAGVPEGQAMLVVKQGDKQSRPWPFKVLKPLPVAQFVYYIAQGEIYKGSYDNGSYTKTKLYGTEANIGFPYKLIADYSRSVLYWIDMSTADVFKAPIDGSGPVQTVLTAATYDFYPGEIQVDEVANKLYINVFKSTGDIAMYSMDLNNAASVPVELYNFTAGTPQYMTISHSLGKIYWEEYPQRIMSANLDGTGSISVVFTPDAGEELGLMQIDDVHGKLYYMNVSGNPATRSFIQVNLADGSNRKTVFTGVDFQATGMELDKVNGLIYWLGNSQKGELLRTDTEGSFMEKLDEGFKYFESFIVDVR